MLCLSRVRLCVPMDCSPPASSVHGILQARVLEWVAMPSCKGSFQLRDRTQVSCIAGGFILLKLAKLKQNKAKQQQQQPQQLCGWITLTPFCQLPPMSAVPPALLFLGDVAWVFPGKAPKPGGRPTALRLPLSDMKTGRKPAAHTEPPWFLEVRSCFSLGM